MIELSPALHDRPKTLEVLRTLSRYICESGMEPGDKFPAQTELRERFGFHNNTLTPAMKMLEECGLLERRRKFGTVLRRKVETSDIPALWRVGMAISASVATEPFYGQLFHFLHRRLRDIGVSQRHYISSGLEDDGQGRFSKFDQMNEDLTDARLDLVLSMVGLPESDMLSWEKRSIPFVHVGSHQTAPCGAIIEQSRMAREAVSLLAERGIKKTALISVVVSDAGFWKSYQQALCEFQMPCSDKQLHVTERGPLEGRHVAERILMLPPAKRPEALIITDDRVASGVAATLANESTYRPVLVVRTNRQAPLAFALPVIHFEIDIDELAQRAVELVQERLLRPSHPQRRVFVGANLTDTETSYLR
ncbi:MAG: hypothetical protein BGO12_10565 [Verrucomicrobia bacterium 61-8]|nr:GntR family transcriptional regulator [Verrucomicrobiota bacterium]OJV20945.1 MAG: hypothetical protein BGO12_10565 [Verrucomicrobia bacterium 61-8]